MIRLRGGWPTDASRSLGVGARAQRAPKHVGQRGFDALHVGKPLQLTTKGVVRTHPRGLRAQGMQGVVQVAESIVPLLRQHSHDCRLDLRWTVRAQRADRRGRCSGVRLHEDEARPLKRSAPRDEFVGHHS